MFLMDAVKLDPRKSKSRGDKNLKSDWLCLTGREPTEPGQGFALITIRINSPEYKYFWNILAIIMLLTCVGK